MTSWSVDVESFQDPTLDSLHHVVASPPSRLYFAELLVYEIVGARRNMMITSDFSEACRILLCSIYFIDTVILTNGIPTTLPLTGNFS